MSLPLIDEDMILANLESFSLFCSASRMIVPEDLRSRIEERLGNEKSSTKSKLRVPVPPMGREFSFLEPKEFVACLLKARHVLFDQISPRQYSNWMNGSPNEAFERLEGNLHALTAFLVRVGLEAPDLGRFRDAFFFAMDFAILTKELDLVTILLEVIPSIRRQYFFKNKFGNILSMKEKLAFQLLSINGTADSQHFWMIDDGRIPPFQLLSSLLKAVLQKHSHVNVRDGRLEFNVQRARLMESYHLRLQKSHSSHQIYLARLLAMLQCEPDDEWVEYLSQLVGIDSSISLPNLSYRLPLREYSSHHVHQVILEASTGGDKALTRILHYSAANLRNQIVDPESRSSVSWAQALLASDLTSLVERCVGEWHLKPVVTYLLSMIAFRAASQGSVSLEDACARAEAVFVKQEQGLLTCELLQRILDGRDISEVRHHRRKKSKRQLEPTKAVRFADITSGGPNQEASSSSSSSSSAGIFDKSSQLLRELADVRKGLQQLELQVEMRRQAIKKQESMMKLEVLQGQLIVPVADSISSTDINTISNVLFQAVEDSCQISISSSIETSGSHRLVRLGLMHQSTVIVKQHKLFSLRTSANLNQSLCALQHLAGFCASQFSRSISEPASNLSLFFVPVQLFQHASSRNYFFVEPFLAGKFIKFNSNNGFVNEEFSTHVVQAFSHYSYHVSNGRYLICDLQGTLDGDTVCLTDPVFLTRKAGEFEKSNLGLPGIVRFFESHKCSDLCRHMLRF